MLERAKKTMAFVLSGEDNKLGGGIYWNEQTPDCKNTCSNGPSAVGALRLYQLTGETSYLDTARRLYDWTQKNLQDPADGLFFDHLELDGSMDPTKWTYNTALMLRAACLLFDETGEQKYLDDAQRMARSAEKHWCTPEGGMKNPGYFCHLLLEAMLELGQRSSDPHWLDLANRICDFLWQHNRDPNGQSPEHWDTRPDAPLEQIKVMWIASNARTYFHVAQANAGKL
jgi:mannose/cellobiose epimerase-like protein (N-acyl-D-glucosamine 2-epimerase family)